MNSGRDSFVNAVVKLLKDEGFGTQGLKIQVSLEQKAQFDISKFLFLSHVATEAEGLSGWMAYCEGVFTPGSIGDVVTKRGGRLAGLVWTYSAV